MSIVNIAAKVASQHSSEPNAVNAFIQTMQANPFGALCFIIICAIGHRSYKDWRNKGR